MLQPLRAKRSGERLRNCVAARCAGQRRIGRRTYWAMWKAVMGVVGMAAMVRADSNAAECLCASALHPERRWKPNIIIYTMP